MTERNENLIMCTGRIMFKNYNENSKRLFLVIGIFTPKLIWNAGEDENDNFNRDFPGFVFEGEKAALFNKTLEVGNIISIRGHVNTEEVMRPLGNNTFRREWRTLLVADDIYKDGSSNGFCNVCLSGEVIRVYRNAEPGHNLYIITIRINNEKGFPYRASFVYFDREMALEPKVGDRVSTSGIIQTKRVEREDGRAVNLLSIVSRFLVIDRKRTTDRRLRRLRLLRGRKAPRWAVTRPRSPVTGITFSGSFRLPFLFTLAKQFQVFHSYPFSLFMVCF